MNRHVIHLGKTVPVLLLWSSCLWAEKPLPNMEKAVSAAETQWRQAVLKGNRSVLANLMADDITYTHSSSLTQTKDQFIESVVSGSTKYQGIDFKTTQMRQYGDTVIVIHDAMITTVQTGVAHLYLTHVWSRQNGSWKMVSRQATKIPAESAK
ncbi:MAG: nuclear transport factor 2 family protein [Acidobacteriaceae bacterium]|nr:nuclear transport factor 2 family protein [Acidobacteriaceae bacterium]MBV9033543.1 nuclear transport factor 2 family protein [Acidobacteriaceae bacterium]MBV9226915.1 nuclear transport factor 2 family protein [Acidobacteriaceae bacterium]